MSNQAFLSLLVNRKCALFADAIHAFKVYFVGAFALKFLFLLLPRKVPRLRIFWESKLILCLGHFHLVNTKLSLLWIYLDSLSGESVSCDSSCYHIIQ